MCIEVELCHIFPTEINNCTDGTHNCDPNASCDPTPESFICTCNSGFTGNGTSCTGISILTINELGFFCLYYGMLKK